MDYTTLPHLNAALNATSGLLLLLGYFFIRRRSIGRHRACMYGAITASILFLASYLTYHFGHQVMTEFKGPESLRNLYRFILFSHIILAVVIVPLVAVTFWRALRTDFARHRRIARWTFPLWLYVSVTGVIVYLILYQLYPASQG